MTTMLMSNPLPLAVLGNPGRRRAKKRRNPRGITLRMLRYSSARTPGIRWSGRRGHLTTNPKGSPMSRRRRHHRHHRHHRRNPGAIAGYVSAAKAAPGQVLGIFKGPNKIKHALYATGGAVGTYLLGGIVAAKLVAPLLSKVPVVGGFVASPMGARIVGGLLPFTVGYVASKFVKGDIGKALLVGGAAASLVELVFPGKVGQLIARIPGVPMLAQAAPAVAAPAIKGPTSGLDGYVSAPSYAGVGDEDALAGYVSAPSYAGVGNEDALAGYVSAPSYAGVGDDSELDGAEDVMAGVGSYIDQAQNDYKSYLAD
jgi:hypothetical protein